MRPNASKVNVQYPPQTGPYKVFVKDKGIWQKHNTARLQISVGSPRHTGEKFYALTEWAAARFDKVILIVSDTLQRHNISLQHGLTLEEAYDASLFFGHRWLKENKGALQNLSASQKVLTTWDHWITHPDFQAAHNEITNLLHTDADVRKAIEEKAASFCQREGSVDSLAQHRSLQTSVTYLLEELAAFSIMFKETPAVDVYPGAWFKDVFSIIANKRASNLMSGFSGVDCMAVDFIKNHFSAQPSPQRQACSHRGM
ncbi:MAG: tRNA-dependent cyclodipeptide synthase [Micavibrio sp.]|nr:tRNA-dependent cyclodipeptide synthase [Micavibrio sp.]